MDVSLDCYFRSDFLLNSDLSFSQLVNIDRLGLDADPAVDKQSDGDTDDHQNFGQAFQAAQGVEHNE